MLECVGGLARRVWVLQRAGVCWNVLDWWDNACGCARASKGERRALECMPRLSGQLRQLSSFDAFEERPSSSNMTRHRYDNGPSKAFDDGRDRR
jgi:hypothetical protein